MKFIFSLTIKHHFIATAYTDQTENVSQINCDEHKCNIRRLLSNKPREWKVMEYKTVGQKQRLITKI
jgi:hypothetical protein